MSQGRVRGRPDRSLRCIPRDAAQHTQTRQHTEGLWAIHYRVQRGYWVRGGTSHCTMPAADENCPELHVVHSVDAGCATFPAEHSLQDTEAACDWKCPPAHSSHATAPSASEKWPAEQSTQAIGRFCQSKGSEISSMIYTHNAQGSYLSIFLYIFPCRALLAFCRTFRCHRPFTAFLTGLCSGIGEFPRWTGGALGAANLCKFARWALLAAGGAGGLDARALLWPVCGLVFAGEFAGFIVPYAC